MEDTEHKEIMVQGQEPWPGYKKAFGVIFTVACVYLATILFFSLPKVLH